MIALTCGVVIGTCIACAVYFFHKWTSELETIREILEEEFKSDSK